MRNKLTVFVTKRFIGTDHFRCKRYISSTNMLKCPFNCLSSRGKWFETVSPLLFSIMLDIPSICATTFTKGFFKELWGKAKRWCELLTHLLPTLIRMLRCNQQYTIHIE